MRQADIFLESEGDAWLERNRHALGWRDPVADMVHQIGIWPKRVLEIGCANGWRLAALREKYDCEVFGVDPSRQACIEAAELRVPATQSSATTLPETDGLVDLVIYGFVLYLCDPDDLFTIAREGNAALKDGGHLIIHDFAPSSPFKRPYKHRDCVWSYHFDQSGLWLSHPAYSLVARNVFDDEAVSVLRKDLKNAFDIEEPI